VIPRAALRRLGETGLDRVHQAGKIRRLGANQGVKVIVQDDPGQHKPRKSSLTRSREEREVKTISYRKARLTRWVEGNNTPSILNVS
jgi:hypothetical protein